MGRLLFQLLKNLPKWVSFLKHSRVSDFLPLFESMEITKTIILFTFQLSESGQKKEKLPEFPESFIPGCRWAGNKLLKRALKVPSGFMLSAEHSEDSFKEIYDGVMGKLCGWRQVVPPNGARDPSLFKVRVIRSN